MNQCGLVAMEENLLVEKLLQALSSLLDEIVIEDAVISAERELSE